MLWEKWNLNPSVSTIKDIIIRDGFYSYLKGSDVIYNIIRKSPLSGDTNNILGSYPYTSKTNDGASNNLFSTIRFINCCHSITFHPAFIQ